jgi:gluconate:H+ symporter, GntP family
LSTIFPAIYVDVQLVLAAPLARSAALRMRGDGLAMMSGTLTAGILVGYVFVVPGLGTVAIAGLLNVPLGTMLIFGTIIGLPTAVLTTFIFGRLLRYGLWNKAKDEVDVEEGEEESLAEAERHEEEQTENTPPLYISLLPILVALLLIAFWAVAEAAGLKSPIVTFFGDPVFALFVGLLGAYLLAWRTLSNGRVGEAMNNGFDATGQILLITGLGALWER